MSPNRTHLVSEIEKLRKEMTEVALEKGMTSNESLHISQELDELLNIYEQHGKSENN